jgi:cell division protein FtsW
MPSDEFGFDSSFILSLAPSDKSPVDSSVDRLRLQDLVTLCVASLLCLGAIMVQSAAMNVTGDAGWHWNERGVRNVVYGAIAFAAFLTVSRIDYSRLLGGHRRSIWTSPAVWMLAVSVFLCAIVLIPGIGMVKNGARRWLPLGPVGVQPSELAKWATVLFLAWWLTRINLDLKKFRSLLITLAPVAVGCLFIVIEDFGTAVLIGLCAFVMLLASGRIRRWHLLLLIPPALGAAVLFVTHEEYRLRRMMSFIDPWAAPRGEGYHMVQSLLSFSTGGLTGRGLGNGVQKLGYLPEDTTDFIFAVVCEELGLFGALLTIGMYLGIAFVSWQIAKTRRDNFGRMLAFGIGAMVCLQAVINIAVATVSVPTKGLSLPLVSAGGSGLVIACGALGMLASVCRFQHAPERESPVTDPKPVSAPPEPAQTRLSEADWNAWTTTV